MFINLNSLSLFLSENKIKEKGAASLFLAISQLKNLNYLLLNLEKNNIGNTEVESLHTLSQLKNLNSLTLFLGESNICDKGAE